MQSVQVPFHSTLPDFSEPTRGRQKRTPIERPVGRRPTLPQYEGPVTWEDRPRFENVVGRVWSPSFPLYTSLHGPSEPMPPTLLAFLGGLAVGTALTLGLMVFAYKK